MVEDKYKTAWRELKQLMEVSPGRSFKMHCTPEFISILMTDLETKHGILNKEVTSVSCFKKE